MVFFSFKSILLRRTHQLEQTQVNYVIERDILPGIVPKIKYIHVSTLRRSPLLPTLTAGDQKTRPQFFICAREVGDQAVNVQNGVTGYLSG